MRDLRREFAAHIVCAAIRPVVNAIEIQPSASRRLLHRHTCCEESFDGRIGQCSIPIVSPFAILAQ
ncbi:hypothetical protein, partial [Mesorhizobium sp. M8A.F.Ca.ET.213.01.1.1]|uniref:hypothetical protein n=1 Tax=Mesorhizobium sp. M8A.F.Ca.ET.213.01.1.1 TaxID=2563970 RepID=UPI001AEEE6E2